MKSGRAAVVTLTLLLILPAVSAQDFSVEVSVENPEVNPSEGETAVFNIQVTNEGDIAGRFNVDYMVSNPGWYVLPKYTMSLEPGETGTSKLYATPGREALEGNRGVRIRVFDSEGNVVKKDTFLTIERDKNIIITGLRTDKVTYEPGETVNATLSIKNVRNREVAENSYKAVFVLEDQNETVFIPSLIASEPEKIEVGLDLGRFDSGIMLLESRVETIEGSMEDTRTSNIRVRKVKNVETTTSTITGLFSSKRVIEARNSGNQEAEETVVTSEVPDYLSYLVSFGEEPSSRLSSDGNVVYRWDLGSLSPGESDSVSYRINYWVPLVLAALLIFGGYTGVREYRKPKLKKKVHRRGDSHSVHLVVRNRSRRPVENAVLKDFVPSIADVIQKFDSSPPETIREGDEVTELEWNLGRIGPREERIFSYRMSPQIMVEGDVSLPSAHLEFEKSGSRSKVHSHPVRTLFR